MVPNVLPFSPRALLTLRLGGSQAWGLPGHYGQEATTMTMIENLHGMLERGVDSALLRYSLGNEFLKNGDTETAIEHLRQALAFDAEY